MSAEFVVPFALLVFASCTCGAVLFIQSRAEASLNLARLPDSAIVLSNPVPANSDSSLPVDDQWARVTSFISAGLSSAENARGFQAAAEEQLDAAQYALKCLVGDLSGILSVSRETPAASAVVHRLRPAVRARTPRKSALAA